MQVGMMAMAAKIALSAFEMYRFARRGLAMLSNRSRAVSTGLVRVGFKINPKRLTSG